MNVIIPPKRGDKGSSFGKLVSYISDRADKPKDDEVLTDEPRRARSQSKKAMFDRLVNYVERADGFERAIVVTETFADGRQRLISGGVSCETNCFSLETASAEMNMVAAQSARCEDPVYHFILSWRENEAPTDAQIFECANFSIRQLGMEGHQYVTAIHQDTDNTHCHVAVNRVNPVDYRAASVWNDANMLQKSCRVLERKYGFIQDNGSWVWGANDQLVRAPFRFGSAPQGTVPLQVYSNTESLYHYAVDQVRDRLSKVMQQGQLTWESAHRLLHERGLGLREQGGGLVIYDFIRPEGPVVKASSVHPTLTKARLEPYIGLYQGPPSFKTIDFDDETMTISSFYQPAFELRDKDARFERRQERADARLDLKLRYQRYRSAWQKPDLDVPNRRRQLLDHYRAVKADVRKTYKTPLLRKLMYRAAEFDQMKAMAELRLQLRSERQMLTDKGLARPLPYRAWIEQCALRGDVAAISQLRGFAYREKRQQRKESNNLDRVIMCGRADDSPIFDRSTHTTQLRRDGIVEYVRDGMVGVIDEGDKVRIAPAYAGYDNRKNFDMAVAVTAMKSRDRVEVIGDGAFVKNALITMNMFNETYTSNRYAPTDFVQRQQMERLQPTQEPAQRTRSSEPDPGVVQPAPNRNQFPRA
ncbi:TraI/MobA(P) family conjugative relaxase [Pseudomonas ovata]|uniref:TraI/MobA(P) family conjugative relaxase n=1 Tax=Pseudomonas ovata TaxID=1839709 RepID=UPI000D69A6B8|nr:TraI/MobA(P) family conjugative relaxase [Pseudomonas ovata]